MTSRAWTLVASMAMATAAMALAQTAPATKPAATKPATPPSKKPAVPDAATQARIEKLTDEAYKDTPQTTVAQKLELARVMLNQAGATGDLNSRYVLYRQARDLAVGCGDLVLAFSAVDRIVNEFDVDGAEAKLALVEKVKPANLSANRIAAGVILLSRVAERELRGLRFDMATKLTVETARLADAVPGSLAAAVRERQAHVRRAKDDYAKLAAQVAALESDPEDGLSNHEVGTFYCTMLNHWSKGLSLLAKSNDAKVAALAKADLAATASKSPERIAAAADGWWQAADAATAPAPKALYRKRARLLYQACHMGLSGLPQTLARTRIKDAWEGEKFSVLDGADEFVGSWQFSGPFGTYPVSVNIDGSATITTDPVAGVYFTGKWSLEKDRAVIKITRHDGKEGSSWMLAFPFENIGNGVSVSPEGKVQHKFLATKNDKR